MPKIAGSCLCGSVRYSSAAEPAMTAVCHCENCQRQTGTAFSIIVGIAADSLEFEGDDNLGEFLDQGETGGAVRRRFCRNCGSPILSLVESAPGLGFIKAGTLEDRSWLNPTMHIWCDTAQPWVEISDDAVKIPRNPTT
ncbi:aldehyde-activating protein [Gammaproteobacteria bacterium]|nr:aldehyde-activating protein [Gammaproteobacteria bacterium]